MELNEVKKQRKEKEEELRIKQKAQEASKKQSTDKGRVLEFDQNSSVVHVQETPRDAGRLSQDSPDLLHAVSTVALSEAEEASGGVDTIQKACPPVQPQWGAKSGDGGSGENVPAQMTTPSQEQD